MITIDWRSCDSMAEIPEQERMEQWVKDLYEQKQRDLWTLEIGSFHGQSTALLSQFGPVLAIDLWSNVDHSWADYDGIGERHFVPFIQNMKRLQLVDRVLPLVASSKVLDYMPFMDFDVVFIDADHDYKEVKRDIFRSEVHLHEGGLLILDDYKRPGYGYPPLDGQFCPSLTDPWIGVARAVDELLEEENYDIVEHYRGKICLKKQ